MEWQKRVFEDILRDRLLGGISRTDQTSLIVVNGLATLVAVFGALTGVYNRFAWGPVGMFGLFTLSFALVTTARVSASQSS